MAEQAIINVLYYRVVNDWTKEVLLVTRSLDEACAAKAGYEAINKEEEISVVAVIET